MVVATRLAVVSAISEPFVDGALCSADDDCYGLCGGGSTCNSNPFGTYYRSTNEASGGDVEQVRDTAGGSVVVSTVASGLGANYAKSLDVDVDNGVLYMGFAYGIQRYNIDGTTTDGFTWMGYAAMLDVREVQVVGSVVYGIGVDASNSNRPRIAAVGVTGAGSPALPPSSVIADATGVTGMAVDEETNTMYYAKGPAGLDAEIYTVDLDSCSSGCTGTLEATLTGFDGGGAAPYGLSVASASDAHDGVAALYFNGGDGSVYRYTLGAGDGAPADTGATADPASTVSADAPRGGSVAGGVGSGVVAVVLVPCGAGCAAGECHGPTASDCTACDDGFFDDGGSDPPSGACTVCTDDCGAGSTVDDVCSPTSDTVCCADDDGDLVCNSEDPCPQDPADSDADGDGICDADDLCVGTDASGNADGDGFCDDVDVCVGDDTSGDSDGDGQCNDTDPCINDNPDDTDGDGLCDSADICPTDPANPDADADLVCDDVDICPGGDDAADVDGDGVPDFCDACIGDNSSGDSDGDGQCDDTDACPQDADNDIDADTVCGDVDNCPTVPNSSQQDSDGNGDGDACDVCPLDDPDDSDGDGSCDSEDPCPTDPEDCCDCLCEGGDADADGICDDYDQCVLGAGAGCAVPCNPATHLDGVLYLTGLDDAVIASCLVERGHDCDAPDYVLNGVQYWSLGGMDDNVNKAVCDHAGP